MTARRWIAVAVFLLILGGGFWLWRSHVTSAPQYSLKQAAEAVEEHDLRKFKKYVDTEDVAERFVDDIVSQAASETSGGSAAGELGAALGQGLARLMKPRLIDRLVSSVERYVETGELPDGGGSSAQGLDPELLRENLQGIEKANIDGSTATVALRFQDVRADTSAVVKLRLREMDGYWQVAEIANVEDLIAGSDGSTPQMSTRELAFDAAAKSDLRNAATLLEAYFADHGRYPATLSVTDFRPSYGVHVVGRGDRSGFVLGAIAEETGHVFCFSAFEGAEPIGEVHRNQSATSPEDCLAAF